MAQGSTQVNSLNLKPMASAPADPALGDMYFDSTLGVVRIYLGTWNDVGGGGGGAPSGSILAFAGSVIPSGYLLCDGSEYDQTTYSALFSAISTTYNTQINPQTGVAYSAPAAGNFRVPDYRGTFLRGVGTASGFTISLGGWQDFGLSMTGVAATAATSGAHTHSLSATAANNGTITRTVSGSGLAYMATVAGSGAGEGFYRSDSAARTVLSVNVGDHAHVVTGTAQTGGAHTHTISFSGTIAETRPQNKGVNYIIKF